MSDDITGILYDIQGYSVHDGPGIRTTVFLKGCPLSCLWCHSPESQNVDPELSWFDARCVGVENCGLCLDVCPNNAIYQAAPERLPGSDVEIAKIGIDRNKCDDCLSCTDVCPSKALMASGYKATVAEVYKRIEKDRIFYGDDGGLTISGGEPMAQLEFTRSLVKRCQEGGYSVCLDTTGFANGEDFDRLIPDIDRFLYDVKHMDSLKHKRLCGVGNERILRNAQRIAQKGGKLQVRIPVIPKINTSMKNLKKTAAFCRQLGAAVVLVQLLPYHKMGLSKYRRIGLEYTLDNIASPSDEAMQKYLDLMKSYGLPAQIH